MARAKSKTRKPANLNATFCFMAVIEPDPDDDTPLCFGNLDCGDPKDARRVAAWLLKFADWAEGK